MGRSALRGSPGDLEEDSTADCAASANRLLFPLITKELPIKSLVFLLVVAALVGTIVAGCGGDGGDASAGDGSKAYDVEASTTMTTASITKAQFVKRVNQICRQAWVVVLDNWDEYSATQDRKLSQRERFEEAVQLSLLAGIDFHIFDEIRQLGAPRGEEGTVEEMIGPFQAAVELGWKKRWTAHSVAEVTPHFKVYNQRAGQYGFDDCLVDESHIKPIEA
jgi:hypothetical protein